jgi:hypothetical protein
MRRPPGIAGATLIYGSGETWPDMLLALQFLLDDLRRDGREVNGVRLSGQTLRLRVEDYELAASLAPEPLPVVAFNGVLRPAQARTGPGEWTHDLARGRLLHAIRHHRWALGVLLRARTPEAGETLEDLDLGAKCRAVVSALIEASPPQFILWQATGVLFTLAEFQNLPPQRLNAPGDPQTAIHPRPRTASARRPVPELGRPATEGNPSEPGAAAEGTAHLPAVVAQGTEPRSRLGRVFQRSAGRIFRRGEDRQRPPELPALDRSQRRLARAFDRDDAPAPAAPPPPSPRRGMRFLGGLLLAISLIFILPPWLGV